MVYRFPPDVEELVRQQMASGDYACEDDLLRAALHALADDADDLSAIRAAIDELRAGDPGQPLADVVDELRRQHGIGTET